MLYSFQFTTSSVLNQENSPDNIFGKVCVLFCANRLSVIKLQNEVERLPLGSYLLEETNHGLFLMIGGVSGA